MNSNSLGKLGEQLFQQRMVEKGYEVTNVSANPEYYYRGDFIVKSPFTHKTKIFECKMDSRINHTGNLYLEIVNIHSKGGKGWYEFCQADYLAYGDAANGIFYIIPLLELKEIVKKLHPRQVNCGFDSVGLLVSLSDISGITQVL